MHLLLDAVLDSSLDITKEIFSVKTNFFGRSICKILFLKFWVIIHLRTFNVARVIASPILKVMRMKKSRFKNFPDRKKFFLQILIANIFPEILSHHAKGLKENTAPGEDGINTRIIKEFSDVLTDPLEIVFNKALQSFSGIERKYAVIVSLIFKGGDKMEAKQWRPINLIKPNESNI